MEIIRGYPDYMRESIEKVEKTRPQRLSATFKGMTLEEREEILSQYHPDYKPEAKREIRFGPSKGQRVPQEVVDLIEAHPLVNPDQIDLSRIDYDVDILIVGGGGAGTVAALWAYYSGVPVGRILITTKLRHGDSNSMMAQGGIQAADRKEDGPPRHYLDALGGGHFTNKPELVKALTMDAPRIIRWHEDLGVMYDKDEKGTMLELAGGGTSRKRMHSARDYTGMEIMRSLRDEARNLEVPVLEFSPAVELLLDDQGKAAGAVLFNMETDQYYIVKAKATILATGGFGRLHIQGFATTNHYGATADGLVMAYHAGVNLIDLDSVQYHPTGAAYPEQIVGLLVTEKVRGLGAQPVNKNGELFVHPLEPRDVESSTLIRECYGRNNAVITPTGMRGVWLDSPMIDELKGKGTIRKNLAAMVRMFERFGIDMTEDPILVFPTLHYQNGGVEINQRAETSIPGLFAAGEVEGGVHGKNRLMGNSLLDYNVFGRRAGMYAAEYVKKVSIGRLSLDHVRKYEQAMRDAGVKTDRRAPMLLPDYRGKEVLSRALDIF